MRRAGPLPDHLRPNLAVIFIGINPGLRSAALRHHFAGHSNRFWKLLYDARLVPRPLTCHDDALLPEWGYGLTNVVSRASRGSADLTRDDYRAGRRRVVAKLRRYRPHLVALLGVSLAPLLLDGRPPAATHRLGLDPRTLGGVRVFVLPNPSGRNAHYSYAVMLRHFRQLGRLIRSVRSPRRWKGTDRPAPGRS